MVVRESLISALLEVEFREVKELDSTHEIQEKLEALYKGDKHSKKC